ncbi:MAG: hypothetical protein QOG88_50, partial [Actinomycetota bacterium]|nr:hypothetical protein [Actinomycetota bacterium]
MGIERQLRDSLRRSAGSLGEPSLRWEALETGPRSAASSWVRVSIAAVVAFSIAIASFVILRDAFSQGPSPATVAPTPPPTDTGVHVPFENLRNGQLYQAGGQAQPLVGELSGGLMGFVSPVGVDSPDGTQVAYNAWTAAATGSGNSIGGTPSIRVIDTSTGSDTLFADGAFSLAWRRDGVIAYFRGRTKTYTGVSPYQGDIVVRAPGGAETTWSAQSDRYIVAAWAGKTLLAYRDLEGGPELLVFDGP